LKISTLTTILHALNHNDVRFLIVGGVAVNLHGYQRMTADLDLVIQLESSNVQAALSVFEGFDYKPSAPVALLDFNDAEKRLDWIENKNMTVFQLWSDKYLDTSIDIFVTEPFDFNEKYNEAQTILLDQDLSIKLISIPTLIDMKKSADRLRDRDDIEHLQSIMGVEDED